jgi:hypothetical protein
MRRTAGSIFHRSLLLFLPADVFSTSELHHFPATGVVAGCWFANDLLDRHCSVRGCGLPCGRGNTLLVRRTRAASSALCTYRSVPIAEHSGDEHSAARRRPASRPWRRAAAGRAYITDPVTRHRPCSPPMQCRHAHGYRCSVCQGGLSGNRNVERR